MSKRQICFAIALMGLLTDSTSATTITVPSQFSTIQDALNAASNGDVVLVPPGTYTQNLSFGTKQIALRSVGGPASTVISVSGGKAVVLGAHDEISGFTITGAYSDFGAGIAVSGLGALIKGNVFNGNAESSGGYGAAIGGNGASPIIDSNIFLNNTADGQYASGVVCFLNSSSPTIENNVFENNPTRAINLLLPTGNSPIVLNNTFVGNTVAINYGSFSTTTFRNNLLAGNGTGFVLAYPNLLPNWDHNLVYQNGTNYSGMADPTGTSGNILANPDFVSGTDFHLLPGSPAINAGSSLTAPALDFDGRARSVYGFDIGAFESVPEPSGLLLLAVGGLALVARMKMTRGRRLRIL